MCFGQEQKYAFRALKATLMSAQIQKHEPVIADTSPVGLGSVFVKPTEVEQRYSQMERRPWDLSGHMNDSMHIYLALSLSW